MSSKHGWPTLTCPECGSEYCSENAKMWQYDEIQVQCGECWHYGPRPVFSSLPESDFVLLVQQWKDALLKG